MWESYLQAAPEAWSSTRLLSLAYAAAGRYEEALRTDRRLAELSGPDPMECYDACIIVLARTGRRDEALAAPGTRIAVL